MKHLINFEEFDSQTESFKMFETVDTTMAVLKNAINKKFTCTIDYRGETKGIVDNGIRFIEPYAVGTNKAGNTVLRAWLTKGKSRKGKIDPKQVPGWRLYRIDRIFSISISLQTFTVAQKGYNPEDQGMEEILYSATF